MAEGLAVQMYRRWFQEIWNEGRAERMEEFLTPDCKIYAVDEAGRDCIGPAEFRPFYDKLRAAFPDIRFHLHSVIGDDKVAAGHWTAELTHTGEGLGVKPSGKSGTINGIGLIRVENGKIVEAWNEWDRPAMMRVAGLA
jgi:steroid delta-isomerase-like uncharacterized protein